MTLPKHVANGGGTTTRKRGGGGRNHLLPISLAMNIILFLFYLFTGSIRLERSAKSLFTSSSSEKETHDSIASYLVKTPNFQQELKHIEKSLLEPYIVKDSSTATVMAMASNYGMEDFRRFIGSLRKTGYKGHVILGVSPDMDSKIQQYLKEQKVMMQPLSYTNCTYKIHEDAKQHEGENSHMVELRTCVAPYSNIKIRWGRFPLIRDWLLACESCTGPVLVTDFRDALFQQDPFLGQAIAGLHVFEEHWTIRTTNWLVDWPVKDCKGIQFDEPMLCSGTTLGTRDAIVKYLDAMYEEMLLWMADPKCNFPINGDDQSIHNYVYYTGKMPFATAIPHRMGIVHTVGAHGAIIFNQHTQIMSELHNVSVHEGWKYPYYGSNDKNWLGKSFDLTDEEGFFINSDGTRSRVVHQYDRLGLTFYMNRLNKVEGTLW